MMWSNQLEAVAHERVRAWESEIARRQLLAHLPPRRTRLHRWVQRTIAGWANGLHTRSLSWWRTPAGGAVEESGMRIGSLPQDIAA